MKTNCPICGGTLYALFSNVVKNDGKRVFVKVSEESNVAYCDICKDIFRISVKVME